MNFAKGLKKFFGVNDSDELDDELDYYGSGNRSYVNPFKKDDNEEKKETEKKHYSPIEELPSTEVDTTTVVAENPNDVPDEILDSLVEIINGNLSPMVLKHLDTEAQKRELMESLGARFAEWVKQTRQAAVDAAAEQWNGDRKEIVEQLSQADKAASSADSRIAEIRARLQESEVKRKAAQAQVTSLQNQVETLEAEKEQYDLENKSLLNKFKVMQVKGEIGDDDVNLADEVVRLKQQLKDLEEEYKSKNAIAGELMNSLRGEAADKGDQVRNLTARIEKMKEEAAAMKEELDEANLNLEIAAEVQEKIEKLTDLIERKNTEIENLKKDKTEAVEKTKHDTRSMVEKEGESVRKERDQALARIAKLEKELDNNKRDAKQRAATRNERDIATAKTIDRLKESLSEANAESSKLQQRADRAEEQEAELKKQLDAANNDIIELETQLQQTRDSLKRTKESLERESAELAELKKKAAEPQPKPQPKPEPKPEPKAEPKPEPEPEPMAMIDDLDDIDWLSPVPPKKPAPKPEPEPETKHSSGDGQMSLF